MWSGFSVVSAEVLQLGLSAPVKLSDSGRSGSRAGPELASAATQPASPRAHGNASDTDDPGGGGKLICLQYLWGE